MAASLYAQEEVWEIVDFMPVSRAGSETVVHGNKIYLIGGYADSVQMPVKWISSYDPSTKQWQFETNMLYPRLEFVTGIYNNNLYIAGGTEYSPSSNKIVEKWNFNTNAVPDTAIIHDYFDRYFPSGFVKDSYIYLIGGITFSNVPFISKFNLNDVNDFTVFDGDTAFGSNPLPISIMTAYLGDWIYIMGGVHYGISQKIHRIDYSLQNMEELYPLLSVPRAQGEAIAVPDNDEIYLIGGLNETSQALNSVDILRVTDSANYVMPGPPLNIARSNFSAVLFENNIYVFGGYDQYDNPVSEIEVLAIGGGIVRAEDEIFKNPTFELFQNYPNPFNPSTTISFEIPDESQVKLAVYSSNGELVKTLLNEQKSAGKYTVVWDSKNNSGEKVAAGVYFYRLSSKDFVQTKSMLLLK